MARASDSFPRLRLVSATFPPARKGASLGRAQLSIVEHALCPLDAASSLGQPIIHDTRYWYTDQNRHRKEAQVRIACPEGLSPTDEFYLWGLLSLTFSQPQPSPDFYATPYYCMRQLGTIHRAGGNYGSKNHALFRAALSRLSTVSYRNDRFYDPVRGEHRQVGFGFLSYSLPIDRGSSRAWRFAWDPIFFEFCQATAGSLRFDLGTYRSLDPASRRLYLLLKKIFWRNDTSPDFELRDLTVNVLGFRAEHETWRLKQKLLGCIEALLHHDILRLPENASSLKALFTKRAKGQYGIRFHRGEHFDAAAVRPRLFDCPLYEPLQAIGLDDASIRHVLSRYDGRFVAEIADMTLAARERKGETFFTTSAPAYFIDNLKKQAAGERTPPDWWRELRKEEERKQWQADRDEPGTTDSFDAAFNAYIESEAREAFGRVMDRIFQDLQDGGQSAADAKEQARRFARAHFLNRFRAEHPEWRNA